MNLRNFQTQLNDAAVQSLEVRGDRDPEVIVLGAQGAYDLKIVGVTCSELDGKLCITLQEAVVPLARGHQRPL